MSDESSSDRQPNGRFAKGNSGGPGRPRLIDRGREFDQLVIDAAVDLIGSLLTAAKAGDTRAADLLLKRVWPARRSRGVQVDAPEIRKTADLLHVGAAV